MLAIIAFINDDRFGVVRVHVESGGSQDTHVTGERGCRSSSKKCLLCFLRKINQDIPWNEYIMVPQSF